MHYIASKKNEERLRQLQGKLEDQKKKLKQHIEQPGSKSKAQLKKAKEQLEKVEKTLQKVKNQVNRVQRFSMAYESTRERAVREYKR